ncbi:MAG: DUF4388 domain-containing protein [Planctomycetes bacterium]|nr:DUF4388 domain-containing protein [Planctomycetota bacterium]
MALNVVKCTNCGRLTPTKSGECFYCQAKLGRRAAGKAPGHEEPRTLGNKKSRFQRRSDDRVHLLLPESGDPIPLDPGKLFVIGRDRRASLVVRSPTVSRQHAELDWDDHDPPRPLLCEIRSSNGTYLNNKPITRDDPQPLRSGDRIRLGESYVLQYLYVNELRIEPELETIAKADTQRIERLNSAEPPEPAPAPAVAASLSPSSSGSVSRGAVDELLAAMDATASDAPLPLEGDLATTRGGDVLQRLHRQRSSGVLEIRSGGLNGRLLLEEGQCIKAFFASLTGRAAMEHVAQLKTGTYQFRPEDMLQPQNMLTQRLRVPIASSGPVPRHGDLRIVSGADLLNALEEESLCGVVRIEDEGRQGYFVFTDGLVEQASISGRVGEAAIDYLAQLNHGSYRIEQERVGSSSYPVGPSPYEPPPPRRPTPPPPAAPPPSRATLRRAALRPSRPSDSGPLRPPSGAYPRAGSDVSSDVAPLPRRGRGTTQRYSSEVSPLQAPHTGRYAPGSGSDVAPLARPRARRPPPPDDEPPARNTLRRRPPPLPGRPPS